MPFHDVPSDKGLAARALSLAYGRTSIIDGLDVAFPTGAFSALIGPNGSGKSTLLRALAGLLSPSAGHVLLDGASISRLPAKQMARQVGMLPQGPVAPEGLTVEALVRQGRYPHRTLFGLWSERDHQACEDALRLTGMEERRESPLDSLSGGQRQRAWLAMALAQETGTLLLDEPTTFLDLAHQIDVMEVITDLVRARGKTVIAVLHDLNQAARYADHMVMLKQGRVIAAGPPARLMSAETIEQVFGVRTHIVADPVTGTPMCVPLGRHQRQSSSSAGREGRSALSE
jgi:iron complex transport system ATP-binding protein